MDELNYKPKKGKGKTIFIIFLILIILGLGGYIVYDKYFIKKETNTTQEKTNEITKLDINSNEVKSLLTSVDVFSKDGFKFSEYYGYFYKHDSLLVNEIPDDVKIVMAIENLDDSDKNISEDGQYGESIITISKNVVSNKMKSLLGNVSYNDTNTKALGCSGGYAFANDTYTYKLIGCSPDVTINQIYTKIIKAEKDNNELNIYVKPIFVEALAINEPKAETKCLENFDAQCIEKFSIYNDYYKQNLIGTTTDIIIDSNLMISDSVFEKHSNKLDTYKFTFDANNHYLKSIKKNI